MISGFCLLGVPSVTHQVCALTALLYLFGMLSMQPWFVCLHGDWCAGINPTAMLILDLVSHLLLLDPRKNRQSAVFLIRG